MKPYPNEELNRMSKREIIRLYKRTVEQFNNAVPVRHGKWLPKHHYIAGYEFVSGHICSECGNDALNAEGDDFLTDFCPNCGVRMDEA